MSKEDDLQERIDELEEQLEEANQEIEDLSSEVSSLTCELVEYAAMELENEQRESLCESSFNAGYSSKEIGVTRIKGWLNYKVEARL